MKQISALLLATLVPLATNYAEAINSYWIEHGAKPVAIQQNNNGSVQTLTFVDFKNGMLVAELEGGVGEISLPVSESMVRTLNITDLKMGEINQMAKRGDVSGALTLLRPKAYPLIKFHEVPESFTQLHVPIRRMINLLIAEGEYVEARDILAVSILVMSVSNTARVPFG